jgi:hypothetical protein
LGGLFSEEAGEREHQIVERAHTLYSNVPDFLKRIRLMIQRRHMERCPEVRPRGHPALRTWHEAQIQYTNNFERRREGVGSEEGETRETLHGRCCSAQSGLIIATGCLILRCY